MVRCNRCGNENPPEAFVCAFCAAKLKFERIERNKFFERPEKKWKRPQGIWKRYSQVFTNPSELFWDLRYDEKRRGGGSLFFINAAMGGLLGMTLLSKINSSRLPTTDFLTYLGTFLTFFVFGLIYHLFLFGILSLFFGVVATRVGGGKKQKKTFPAMMYAFFPSILNNALSLLILLIMLPQVNFSGTDIYGSLAPLFQDQVAWKVVNVISFIIYAAWIPLLAALCIRSLYEISTTRSLIGCYIVGVIVAIVLFLTRGSFVPSAIP